MRKNFENMLKLTVLFICCLLTGPISAEFEDSFKNCYPNVSGFDACIRQGLNQIRPYFKTGLAQYNVAPFDPFFAEEIAVMRGLTNFGFTLTLKNVTESGWTQSKVTKFVSDLPNNKVVYTQSFPAKFLSGSYEFEGRLLGSTIYNKGKFTLDLYDLTQTTTATRMPNEKVKVRVNVETIGNLKLHISNLLRGRAFFESLLDRIINGTWQPGFLVTRGIINDLVSTAFTEIFGNAFQNFPFDKVVGKKSSITYQ